MKKTSKINFNDFVKMVINCPITYKVTEGDCGGIYTREEKLHELEHCIDKNKLKTVWNYLKKNLNKE